MTLKEKFIEYFGEQFFYGESKISGYTKECRYTKHICNINLSLILQESSSFTIEFFDDENEEKELALHQISLDDFSEDMEYKYNANQYHNAKLLRIVFSIIQEIKNKEIEELEKQMLEETKNLSTAKTKLQKF